MNAVLQTYDKLEGAAALLDRAVLRRAISEGDLVRTVKGLVADFRAFVGNGDLLPQAEVSFSGITDWDAVDLKETMDVFLESVRRIRGKLKSPSGERIRLAVREQLPSLAKEYEAELERYLPMLDEYEKFFVALGAGSSDDLHVLDGMIPTAADLGLA